MEALEDVEGVATRPETQAPCEVDLIHVASRDVVEGGRHARLVVAVRPFVERCERRRARLGGFAARRAKEALGGGPIIGFNRDVTGPVVDA